MTYLKDAAARWLEGQDELPPARKEALEHFILPITGHYRLERFDQRLLEDYRQRVARKGVSLLCFQQAHLPVFQALLTYAHSAGMVPAAGPLFQYQLPPLFLDRLAPGWLGHMEKQVQPSTIARYRSVLECFLLPYWGQSDLRAVDREAVERYRAHYDGSGGSASSFTFHTTILYGVIDFAAAQAIEQAGLGTPTPPKLTLFRDVIPPWAAALPGTVSPSTAEAYLKISQSYVLPFLGRSSLQKMNTRRLTLYRRQCRAAGLSDTYLAKHLTVIYSILQYAVDTGQLEQLPQLEFPYPKITPEIHQPDPAAMEQIFLHQTGPGVTVLRLAWQAGLTRSEIQSLQWRQIHLPEQQLSISGRQVPVQPELGAYLSVLRQDRPSHEHVLLSRLNAPVSDTATLCLNNAYFTGRMESSQHLPC